MDYPRTVPYVQLDPGSGKFTDGNPLTALPPSNIPAEFLDDVADSIIAVQTAGGIAAAENDTMQLTKGVQNISGAHGQCRLVLAGGNLALNPVALGYVMVGGARVRLPAAGIVRGLAGVYIGGVAGQNAVPGKIYDAYAWSNAGAPELDYWDASAGPTHMADTGATSAVNTGVEVRSNGGVPDSSRTYIGKFQVNAGPALADTPAQRFIASWFNRRPRKCAVSYAAGYGTSYSTYPGIAIASQIAEWLGWADDSDAPVALEGQVRSPAGSGWVTVYWNVMLDGVALNPVEGGVTIPLGQEAGNPSTGAVMSGLAEGYHKLQAYHRVDIGQTIQTSAASLETTVRI